MSTSLKEAKDKVFVNLTTNIAAIVITAVITLLLTPYLIKKLGLAVYGIVPLVNSVVQYFSFFTMSLSGAVSRFVTFHYAKDDFVGSNNYFNSALFFLVGFCCVALIPVFILMFFFGNIFNVPLGQERSASVLLVLCYLSSSLFIISSPFSVSAFAKHRFDISNYINISSKLLQVLVLVVFFEFLGPRLEYYGISHIFHSTAYLVLFIVLHKYLTPELKVSIKYFNWSYLKDLGVMSFWLTINLLSVFLYVSIGLVLINIFLNSEEGGKYGSLVQWLVLLQALGQAVSNLFTPIAIAYVADKDFNTLTIQLKRIVRLMGFVMALPIGLLCGFAKPLITWWLGEELSYLWPLMWLLLMPWIVTISYKPILGFYRAVNRMMVPAILSMTIGIVNVVIAVILLKFSNLGIYGVAIALAVPLIFVDLIGTSIYAAHIIKHSFLIFIKAILPGILLMLATSVVSLTLGLKIIRPNVLSLGFGVIVISLVYFPVCYWIVMNRQERQFVKSLIFKNL